MKTLYVSDLDGTLLNSNESLSEYAIKTLNTLIDNGMYFTYATARSFSSSSIVTRGLLLNLPVITYNGTFFVNPNTREILFSLSFNKQEKETITKFLDNCSICPLVYGFIDGEERVSWIRTNENKGIKHYLNSRKGDIRLRPIDTVEQLCQGELFHFTFMEDDKENLIKIHEFFKDKTEFICTIQKEFYRDEYWCELMPQKSTKGNAVLALKDMLNFDKIISFGDEVNDISMFKISDECYAVENAVNDLKEYSNGIISSNDKDGVVHWLENREQG